MGFFNLQACKFLNGNSYLYNFEHCKTDKNLKILTFKLYYEYRISLPSCRATLFKR
jgi:hypothetical protein